MRSRRSTTVATFLVALATICGVWGIHRLIALEGLTTPVIVTVLAAAVAVGAVRSSTRSRVWPTVAGLAGIVLIAVPTFSLNDEGQRALLPTPGALDGLLSVLRAGIETMGTGRSPLTATHEVTAVVALAAAVLFVVADAVAVSGRAAAIAGLILVLPWLPAVVYQYSVSLPPLFIAIGAWIALLSWSRPSGPGEQLPRPFAIIASATAAVGVLALVAPTAIGGPGWGALPQLGQSDTSDIATRLNLELDLRRSLTERSQSTVFSYATLDGAPDIWRLYALSDFDGSGWQREETEPGSRGADTGVLWPVSVDSWQDITRQRIDVQVATLAESSLPVPALPRTVEVGDQWFYDPGRDEISSASTTTEGLRYTVITAPNFHQSARLLASEGSTGVEGADNLDPRYVALDPSMDLERIAALATEVAGSADTRYDQMVALQNYLRDPAEFTYNVTVSPGEGDAVSRFLDERVGYCVQFATTMVVMARSLGVPARIAVGFLPGDPIGNSNYVVTGSDAHAWPEIYFPDHGWVRFEPTPAVQTGAAPAWTNPYPFYIPVPREILDGTGVPEPTVPDVDPGPQDPGNTETPTGNAATASALWWIGGTALVVVLGAVLWWWKRRRSALADLRETPETVWEQLIDRLPEDLRWPATETTWEAHAHLERALEGRDHAWDEHAARSWLSLTQAMVQHRYAPQGTEHGVGQLEQWADEVVAAVQPETTTRSRGRLVRAGARSAPQHDA